MRPIGAVTLPAESALPSLSCAKGGRPSQVIEQRREAGSGRSSRGRTGRPYAAVHLVVGSSRLLGRTARVAFYNSMDNATSTPAAPSDVGRTLW